jgi:hypothetical protein
MVFNVHCSAFCARFLVVLVNKKSWIWNHLFVGSKLHKAILTPLRLYYQKKYQGQYTVKMCFRIRVGSLES